MRAAVVAGDASVEPGGATRCGRSRRWAARSLAAAVSTARAVRLHDAGRLRVAVVDYGCKRSILRRLAARGRRGDGVPARRRRRTSSLRFDGVAPLERPGRPGAARGRGGGRPRAARPRAGARDLPRPPAARARRPATGRSSSRSATAARTIRCWSARPGACSSRARTTASRSRRPTRARRRTSRSTTARSRGSTSRELRARSVQFHPEAGPGPHDAWPIIDEWVEEVAYATAA